MAEDDNLSDDELDSSEEINSPKKAKPRGPTTGKRSAKKKGPRHIEFDENDVPIGEWSTDFCTQLGVRAQHIKITFKTWKEVPIGKKNTIWGHMKKKYSIKDDTYKEVVLRIVSRRFSGFKSRLRAIFIYKTRKPSNQQEQLGDPLLIYKQISTEDWTKFVKQANDPLFKCPQQPEDFECGYYVMKWMYDITVHYGMSTVPLEQCISKSTVAAKDINRVREFWCRKFVEAMYT